ncbi:MAG: diguanylate cyclase [Bacteroidetes bacterium GWF2_38_335]|nr:MAG: diguanylate cyclase [Bacteroidetes bacterium GWF2_38_335]OFY78211.1 MAG: diguanylate cyclase [Bacteroidetes bacterium RIFOXYA12_FULL_38_20]HBS88626.1 diguanylate cyclase [Bacteroidales bacterium]
MANLETTYMGITLKNPIIISSSGLTSTAAGIKKIEEQGAAAVVLKSLFEEQINYDAGEVLKKDLSGSPEADDYVRGYIKSNSLDSYLQLISDTKKSVKIPVFASINCVSAADWTDFAKKIEKAGADGIELNINFVPNNPDLPAAEIEKQYLEVFEKVKAAVKIPVAVKISAGFTNVLYIINQLKNRGAAGVVLFNRLYEPDIDLNTMSITATNVFSSSGDLRQSLRWIGIASSKIDKIELSASTGIHDGESAFKMILAGAKTVQICSVLYKSGLKEISNILTELEKWMEKYNYKKLDEFRGKMNYKSISNPLAYERSQFMKYFSSRS